MLFSTYSYGFPDEVSFLFNSGILNPHLLLSLNKEMELLFSANIVVAEIQTRIAHHLKDSYNMCHSITCDPIPIFHPH